MKLKFPSKLQVWGSFWALVGKLLLNKYAMVLAALLLSFGAGVYTSRDVLTSIHETGNNVVNYGNAKFEQLGIAYRLEPPKATPIPEFDDPLLYGDGILPPMPTDYDVNIVVNKDLYPYDGRPPN